MQQVSKFDREWLDQKYTVEHLSAQQIADLVGAKLHQVYTALRQHGIRTRPRGHNLNDGGKDRYLDRPDAIHPWIGRRHAAETIEKIRTSATRSRPAVRGKRNGMYGRIEEANPNWKGGVSPERQRIYSWAEWKEIVAQVRERDGHRCRRCKSTEKLETHHLCPWDDYPDLRFDLDNLITLCNGCHDWVESKENTAGEWRGGHHEEGKVC